MAIEQRKIYDGLCEYGLESAKKIKPPSSNRFEMAARWSKDIENEVS